MSLAGYDVQVSRFPLAFPVPVPVPVLSENKDYVRRLEAALEERGVDLAPFQSIGNYKKNDLEL